MEWCVAVAEKIRVVCRGCRKDMSDVSWLRGGVSSNTVLWEIWHHTQEGATSLW